MRARLHLRHGRFGFFREGTHDWCDPAPTGQLLPETLATVQRLERAIREWPERIVTDVTVGENVPATGRLLHLELAPGTDPSRLAPLRAIDGATGVSAAAVDGVRVAHLAGDETIAEDLTIRSGADSRSFRLTRHAQSFFQGNRFLLQALVDAVIDAAVPGRLLDLYAGVGLFSVAAAARGNTVTAVEGDRHAAADLEANAMACAGHLRPHHQSVEAFLETRRDEAVTTIIVDPPRTGMTQQAVAGVIARCAPRIVYLSCDVATLARDARRLVDAGYGLARVDGFDLFPDTAHIESLAVFER
jgi:tRNA/tmRNA/rRNA uracil-C5-methylase (TrmA/RlmC/RlmD family)